METKRAPWTAAAALRPYSTPGSNSVIRDGSTGPQAPPAARLNREALRYAPEGRHSTGRRKFSKAQLATCFPCLRASSSAKRKWMPS